MTENIQQDVQKADASQQRVSLRLSEIGNPNIQNVSGYIFDNSKFDLQFPQSTETFRLMREDATIEAVFSIYESLIRKALYRGRFVPGPSRSEASRRFANYLNWNFRNLRDGYTWYKTITDMLSCYQYGFSVLEKVWERNYSTTHDQYRWKIAKMPPRPQSSISKWTFRGDNQTLRGLEQYPPRLSTRFGNFSPSDPTGTNNVANRRIPIEKAVLCSWNSTGGNPQGRSPLVACYKYWKEKVLIENYEVVGFSKDMGGVIVLRAPTELINKAQDPNSDEALTQQALLKDAANIHAGQQSYIFLPSDTQGSAGNGEYEYDFTLQGIEGGGKQYTSTDLINERKKAILDVFGAGFLNTGNEVAGSYNLVEGQIGIHAHLLEDHLLFYKDIIENQIVAQMAALNGLDFSDEDMPRWESGDINEYSPDEIGKLVQRTFSVGGFVKTKENIIEIHRRYGLDTTHMEEMTLEELMEAMAVDDSSESRAGESNGTSGTGTSQNAQGGDMNLENRSANKLISDDGINAVVQLLNKKKITMPSEDVKDWIE